MTPVQSQTRTEGWGETPFLPSTGTRRGGRSEVDACALPVFSPPGGPHGG